MPCFLSGSGGWSLEKSGRVGRLSEARYGVLSRIGCGSHIEEATDADGVGRLLIGQSVFVRKHDREHGAGVVAGSDDRL